MWVIPRNRGLTAPRHGHGRASLADLQEGAKIKGSYESREGKNVATRIEVMPAQ